MFKGLNALKALPLLFVVHCSVADEAVDEWETIASTAPEKSEERGYVKPFQLFDNVYYVGDKWVSAFLLDTGEGLILIDTLEYPYSKWLPHNIKQAGFDPKDVKAILITHGHSDHVGGAGILQSLTNAKVIMHKDDLPLLHQQALKHDFPTPTISRFPTDGETFVLGDTTIKFYETPGHTKGCMSLEFSVYHESEAFRAFVVCGNGTNFQGIGLARNYMDSVKRIRQLANQTPEISVNLSTHPHLGQIIKRHESADKTPKNPYVDSEGFQSFLSLLQERGRKKFEEELGKVRTSP